MSILLPALQLLYADPLPLGNYRNGTQDVKERHLSTGGNLQSLYSNCLGIHDISCIKSIHYLFYCILLGNVCQCVAADIKVL